MEYIESRTKIIATIGPASSDISILKKMIRSGVDVCRINFSHGDRDFHNEIVETVRKLNRENGFNTALLGDLQGPKIRVGELKESIFLETGKSLILTTGEVFSENEIPVDYPGFVNDVKVGDPVLVDDGKIKLRIEEIIDKSKARAVIDHGGELRSRKGMNLPETKIALSGLTGKDKEDVDFALEKNLDWIALSFVRKADDILELREYISDKGKEVNIIAKIEKPEALKEIDRIIDASDGIMVARGDLGVEVEFHRVPVIQKNLVEKCVQASKPVIIATQMMESMISNFQPTRAEANDVSNAVVEGADTLMLSAETSIGQFPVQVIRAMHNVIQYTEEKAYEYFRGLAPETDHEFFIADSVCYHAVKMAQQLNAKAIITFSNSGYTAYRISSYRPKADIFMFTGNHALLSMMSLVWGVRSYHMETEKNIDSAIDFTIRLLRKKDLLVAGDVVIHAGSTPLYRKEATNMLKISKV